MELKDLEFHDSIKRQLRTIELLTMNLIKCVEQHQQGTESSKQPSTDNDEYDGFDFGAPTQPVTERLCKTCLEELSIYDINTPHKKHNFICERCIDKRAVAQTNQVNIIYGQELMKEETLQTQGIDKRKYRTSVKMLFWIIVAACVSLLFI